MNSYNNPDCSLNEMNNNELFYLHSYMDLLEDDVYNHFIPFCCIYCSLSSLSSSKHRGSTDTLDIDSVAEEGEEHEGEGEGKGGGVQTFGIEETRDLLICFLFVLNHIEQSK